MGLIEVGQADRLGRQGNVMRTKRRTCQQYPRCGPKSLPMLWPADRIASAHHHNDRAPWEIINSAQVIDVTCGDMPAPMTFSCPLLDATRRDLDVALGLCGSG
jgi:hypothetical protein